MKERPILFSGPMVRAIIEGRKTQTRRVMKPQPTGEGPFERAMAPGIGSSRGEYAFKGPASGFTTWHSPFGSPGDRLWVREAFADASGAPIYRATSFAAGVIAKLRWRPSIHMPRAYSRLTLEITGVRVQRLQEISEEDANKEGCPLPAKDQEWTQCRPWFKGLWTSLAKPCATWADNPWVWVIEFKACLEGRR